MLDVIKAVIMKNGDSMHKYYRIDPLYAKMAVPRVFCQEDAEIQEESMMWFQQVSPKKRLSYPKVSKMIAEIEGLLNASNSEEEGLKTNKDLSLDEKKENKGYRISKLGEKRHSISTMIEEPKNDKSKLLKEWSELNKEHKAEYEMFQEQVKQRTTFANWKRKYVPKDVALLEKILVENPRKEASKKPQESLRQSLCQSTIGDWITDRKKVRPATYRSAISVDKTKFHKDSPKAMKKEQLKVLYILKKKERKEAELKLEEKNACFSKNPNRFNGKRFQRNPRFAVWLKPDLRRQEDISFPPEISSRVVSQRVPLPISRKVHSKYPYDKLLTNSNRNRRSIIIPTVLVRPVTASVAPSSPPNLIQRKGEGVKLQQKLRKPKRVWRSIANPVNLSEYVDTPVCQPTLKSNPGEPVKKVAVKCYRCMHTKKRRSMASDNETTLVGLGLLQKSGDKHNSFQMNTVDEGKQLINDNIKVFDTIH